MSSEREELPTDGFDVMLGHQSPSEARLKHDHLLEGWYSRGYLPHVDHPGLHQFITFRLHDSIPQELIEGWKEELAWRADLSGDDAVMVTLRRRVVEYEDAGHGACWLADARLAGLVEDALVHFDGQHYRLLAWCIMPNHVHVLIETCPGYPLAQVVHSWKSYTAHRASRILARNGPFWERDYYDRFIRDDNHLARALSYIEQNPVHAGLVMRAEEWNWSSATRRG